MHQPGRELGSFQFVSANFSSDEIASFEDDEKIS